MRVVKVNSQLINGIFADKRQLFSVIIPGDVVLFEQGQQLGRVDAVDQRIEENPVIKQIVAFGGAHVVRRV
ncbi:Uncharacterised protein [Klebsiella pneumoniae]|nr:Uncharacterised protein [Klebsiella pneumoniae]